MSSSVPLEHVPLPTLLAGPRRSAPGPDAAALLRVHLTYLWRHKRRLRLAAPTRFTEMVQVRKLYDRDPRLPLLADKLAVKQFVRDRLGSQWVIPTLWHGSALPAAPAWEGPFVVKARHGCRQSLYVRTGREDWQAIRHTAAGWMRRAYGAWLDEWLYRHIERGILVEPFIGVGDRLPVDYKFYVFHGRVEFIQVHVDRESRHRWMLFDRAGKRVSAPSRDPDPAMPARLARIIEAAEALGRGLDFVRADFYAESGRPRFGELTFYPGSGLDPFDRPALDLEMGRIWRRLDPRDTRPIAPIHSSQG